MVLDSLDPSSTHSTGKRYDIYSKRKIYNKERNTKKREKEQKDKIIVLLWK